MGPALLAWVLVRRAHAGRRLPPEDAGAEGRRRQRPDVPPAGEGLGRQSPMRRRGTAGTWGRGCPASRMATE